MRKARNDPALQATNTQHAAPVFTVDADRSPPIRPVFAKLGARMLFQRAVELRRVQLRVLQVGPDAANVSRLGGDAQAQAAVHVCAELELGRLGGAGRRERQLGEAVGDGLELQQGRQLDVHVWLADLGLHNGLYRLWVQDSHGNVLRDDFFVLSSQRGFEVLCVELVVVVWVAKGVVRSGPGLLLWEGVAGGVGCRRGGCDC